MVKTAVGGHLGFAEGLLPLRDSWVDDVAIEWFSAVQDAEDTCLSSELYIMNMFAWISCRFGFD